VIAVLDPQRMRAAEKEEVRDAIDAARGAQIEWARRPVAERAKLIGEIRPLLAADATEIARVTAAANDRPIAEKIVSEVIPLLDACKFLQRNAARALRSKRFGARGRPVWLHGSSFEVQRKPYGIVLIVTAGNYPLFLPGVQMLHALVAGNAVLLKPAEGASAPIARLTELAARAGIPANLIQLLPESTEAARQAARLGADKAIFTGSSENGRNFLAHLAHHNTPSVMELSGADTVYVRADADVRWLREQSASQPASITATPAWHRTRLSCIAKLPRNYATH
jgi:acyl-CoA reductase-like NAD-dependent aldehyde dehydrogenase